MQPLPCQENSIPRHTISFIGFLCLPVSIIIVFCVPGRVIMLVTYSAEIVFLNWHNLHKHLKSKGAQHCSWLWCVWSPLLQNCQGHWDTPKSYFPGTPGFQQNRALSLQLKLRNECFHSLKRKKKKRSCIIFSVTERKQANLPLALAVVAFIPLIALVCICIIIALKRIMTQTVLMEGPKVNAWPRVTAKLNSGYCSFQRSLRILACHREGAQS